MGLPLALASTLLLGVPATATAPAAVRDPVTTPAATKLYTPSANPAAYRQALALTGAGQPREAAGLLAMVRTPQAVWLPGGDPAAAERETRRVVQDALRHGALPALVLYNIPGRDCAQYSAGGADDSSRYRAWIAAVARGIGPAPALVVLEPDALALLPADCPKAVARAMTAARYADLGHAVTALGRLAHTKVYLDAGHPAWHAVSSIVPRLVKGGITGATGFTVNVSNYSTDSANAWYGRLISSCLAHVGRGGRATACAEQRWSRARARTWLDKQPHTAPDRMKHFVTDSSRNGRGPWTPPAGKYRDAQDWCNPPGRGLGARPTTETKDPLHDARLWIKTPGESDGQCLRGTSGPMDPERRTVGPKAGDWFTQQAFELVRLARPSILPGPAALKKPVAAAPVRRFHWLVLTRRKQVVLYDTGPAEPLSRSRQVLRAGDALTASPTGTNSLDARRRSATATFFRASVQESRSHDVP
ncbi:glycoside hydrolase family 6 protein [Streptomyces sp. H27-C3]|uniref:glycoside hydrolase family 6 protein n=1 Tax=Streptomyces sp. H27-C3 TaxID=3046305 RepID=UPI0032D97AFD